jgi:hypothetical protein
MQPWLKARDLAFEQVLGRRVVQVDVPRIGEHELDHAQRVAGPGGWLIE